MNLLAKLKLFYKYITYSHSKSIKEFFMLLKKEEIILKEMLKLDGDTFCYGIDIVFAQPNIETTLEAFRLLTSGVDNAYALARVLASKEAIKRGIDRKGARIVKSANSGGALNASEILIDSKIPAPVAVTGARIASKSKFPMFVTKIIKGIPSKDPVLTIKSAKYMSRITKASNLDNMYNILTNPILIKEGVSLDYAQKLLDIEAYEIKLEKEKQEALEEKTNELIKAVAEEKISSDKRYEVIKSAQESIGKGLIKYNKKTSAKVRKLSRYNK